MTTEMNDHVDIDDYIRAARDLETAIRFHRSDTAFAERGGTLVYLADTNVAEALLRDTQVLRETNSSSIFVSNLMTKDAAELSDRLAYRYIFSGRLPGEKPGEPIYVSQLHWAELLRRARSIAREFDQGLRGHENLSDAELQELRDLSHAPELLITRAETLGLQRIVDRIRKAVELKERINAVFADNPPKLKALDWSPYWEEVSDNVSMKEVRRWTHFLALNRRRRERDVSLNIEADATTLATITALYREYPRSIGPDASVRFIFLTFDSGILKAYADRKSELHAEGIPAFIRRPLIYHPLLNFSAMRKISSTRISAPKEVERVLMDVEEAISTLFQTDDPRGIAKTDQGRDLKDNIERWSIAAERISISNARLFADEGDDAREGQEIASFFDSREVLLATGKSVHAAIAEIEHNHANAMSALMRDRLLLLLERKPKDDFERRTPIRVRESVDVLKKLRPRASVNLSGIRTLDDLLDRIFSQDSKVRTPGLVNWLSTALKDDWEDPDIQLLAAGLFMAAGRWDEAHLCAEQCIQLAVRRKSAEVIIDEARYCKALSLRMTLRSKRDVERAQAALNSNLADPNQGPLFALRERVELFTLTLTACIVQTLSASVPMTSDDGMDPVEFFPSDQVAFEFDKACRALDSSLERLGDDFLGSDTEGGLVNNIVGQAAVNRLGSELFRHFFAQEISDVRANLKEIYGKSVELLHQVETTYPVPLMGRVYLRVAEMELGMPHAKGDLIALLGGADERTTLAEGDKSEYEYFRTRITAEMIG